jgi:hypothetical protein
VRARDRAAAATALEGKVALVAAAAVRSMSNTLEEDSQPTERTWAERAELY